MLGLNLNPPNVLPSTDWIKPMKYVGIWWGMHINTMTWASGPKHGATTENTKQYIDFAAANGLGGVLVEGWNIGWDGDWIANRKAFSFTQAYPDYDLPGRRGVREVEGRQAHRAQRDLGRDPELRAPARQRVRAVPLAGPRCDQDGLRDRPDDRRPLALRSQFMVRHYRKVIETAAKYQIMLDVHEPMHDTGERRTYPNMMSREGARGQEYNAWSGDGGNPPEHETILFFTRMLAGPMDFTPGIFDILLKRAPGRPRGPDEPRVRTTLAKQLALYVVLYSPLQMAADLPENYAEPAGVPVHPRRGGGLGHDARARRDRSATTWWWRARSGARTSWFLGAITDEEARTFDVPLSFLTPRPALRRGDLRRRTGRELAHESVSDDITKRTRDVCLIASHWSRAGRRPGDQDSPGAMTIGRY